ncbi:MAG TPA: hypothetical protein VKN63_07770, partial [Afifellaceae bacterium]|nr:hypothetical protein [Afifellaceae bacterium]
MKFSFTRFKDRISSVTNAASRKLGAAPRPVQVVGYGLLRGLLWGLYYWPRSHMKKTARALAAATGTMTPREIYRGFANGLTRTALRMERISQGRTSEIDALFRMPEKERFETLLQENGGMLMVMPHCHGSLLTVRCLAARYPTLMLIREPKNDARAEAQRRFFAHLGCEVLDVRRASEAQVARSVLKAL